MDYTAETAAVVPDLPYYYYHMPSMNNVSFPMIEFLMLADSTIPNLAGIKYTHTDINDYKRCLEFQERKYNIFFGRDEFLIDALKVGASSGIGSTYNIMLPLYQELLKTFHEKNIDEAKSLQGISVDTCKILYDTGSFGSALKAVMRLIGLDLGGMRRPQKNLTKDKLKTLEVSIKNSEVFNWNISNCDVSITVGPDA